MSSQASFVHCSNIWPRTEALEPLCPNPSLSKNTAHQIALCCDIHTNHPINEQYAQHEYLELSYQGWEASGLLIKEQKLTNLSSSRLMDSCHCHFSLRSFVLTMVVRPFLQTPCCNNPISHLGSGRLLQSALFRFLDPRRISSWKSWNNSSQTIVGFITASSFAQEAIVSLLFYELKSMSISFFIDLNSQGKEKVITEETKKKEKKSNSCVGV